LVADRWVPGDAEPFQIFEDGFGELWLRSLSIEVLDTEEEFASGGLGPFVSDPEGCGVPAMEKTSWRGSEASAIWRKSHVLRTAYM
jgi:hypothetical protein